MPLTTRTIGGLRGLEFPQKIFSKTSTLLDKRLFLGTLGIVPTTIYCLKDPTTGDVRYIGQTNSLGRRFKQHLIGSAKGKNHLGNWLRGLKGQEPLLAVLHEVAENESWAEEERRYISCARALGMRLVNATDGGEGTLGYRHSTETRADMSTAKRGVPRRPFSTEHCAALSVALKGVPLSPERCAAMRGPKSPEHCAALSAAQTGVPKSPGTRAAISAALTGVPQGPLSPETRASISAALTGVPKSPSHCEAMRESWVLRKMPYFLEGDGI